VPPDDLSPGAVLGSPEKADLVRAIEDARIASDLARLGLHLADGTMAETDVAHALACYESRKLWLANDAPNAPPGHFAALDDAQRKAYRDVALEWIAGHGGTFPSAAGVWRADGKRLWKAMM
jgi:hypothetical protein